MEQKTTCQICGRTIKAKTGVIAHHGYKRPGDGWQTNSCIGALELPYEVSCDLLREVLEQRKNYLNMEKQAFVDFQANPPQVLKVNERFNSYSKYEEKEYQKPEGFDPKKYYVLWQGTYEHAYQSRFYQYERAIQSIEAEIVFMEKRLSAWVAPIVAQ